MKKRKRLNLLKLGIFLFGFSMFLWNCQENEETIPRAKIENEFTVTTIGRKQLIKNNAVNNRVEKINNKKQQQKSTKTNSNDFVVVKDFITYIENNDGTYHSYTFPIKRTTTENYNLENLIISLNKDGSYKAVLVTYYFFNEQERNEFKINKGRNYNGEISYKEITSEGLVSSLLAKDDVMNCIYVIYESCSYGNHVGGMLDDGSTCPGYTTSFDRVCTSRGGTDDSDTNTSTNPEGSGNDNDTNGGSGETGVITFPTFTDCPDNKVYNETTKNCECPTGKIEDSNGNCVKDPCNEIKKHLSTSGSNIKPELNILKTKVDYPGEKSYAFIKKADGTFLNREVAVPALNFNSVKIPTGNGVYAGAHTHTDDLHNMFSWSDVHTLYSLYNDASNDMKSNAMLYLVARQNTTSPAEVYGIIVEDFNKLKNQLNKDIVNTVKNDLTLKNKSLEDIIKEINKNLGDQYTYSSDLNKTFLDWFKNHGIKLFKGDSNLSNFSELALDATTNTVKQTPC